jgi:hypothetical protein
VTGIGWGLIAAGAVLCALGGFSALAHLMRRRPWVDVLDMIEAQPPRTGSGVKSPAIVMPLRCICTARRSFCDCAVDGVRNPRGAGRARMAQRERNIADAVRTGIPCRPIANTHDVYCGACGEGPCRGVDRVFG